MTGEQADDFAGQKGKPVAGAERVFLYGTLLAPERLDALVAGVSAWRRVGEGTVRGRLYDLGEYPALRPSKRARDRVPGALFEFDSPEHALAILDEHEELPRGLYARRRWTVRCNDGSTCRAWVYVYVRRLRSPARIERWHLPSGGG